MDPLLAPAQRALIVLDDVKVANTYRNMMGIRRGMSRYRLSDPRKNDLRSKLSHYCSLLVSYSEYVVSSLHGI
jgi:hypothetical protein